MNSIKGFQDAADSFRSIVLKKRRESEKLD
jgi:hypothetical protein